MPSTRSANGERRIPQLPRGAVFGLGAALLFGVSAPVAKLLLEDVSPQLLAGLLYLGSGSGLAIVWAMQRHARVEARLTRTAVPWLAAAIGFGGILGPLLLMIGLLRTPASSASLLLNMEAVFTALIAWFVFRENFDGRIALGMFVIVLGGALLSWQGRVEPGSLIGPLAVAGATLCWGIDNNLTQNISSGDPVQIAMLKGLVAGCVNTVIAVAVGAHWPGVSRIGAALGLGFLSYGVSLVLFVLALRHLGTARTGAYFSIAPFVGAAASLILFRERPNSAFLAAAALMGAGVWLHVSERHEHKHHHEALEHEHLHVHDDHHHHVHGPDDPRGEPHSHKHRHEKLTHSHPHYPDIHHRHKHD